ncbi:MAG: hypothetical protein Q9187_000680 [Circinaria calcarea]
MESLSLQDLPPTGGPNNVHPPPAPQGAPQLPPQDLDKDDYIPDSFRKASPEEVHALTVRQAADRKRGDKVRQSKLQELGFEVEHTGEILF